jgi:hypothetical protein
MHNLTNDFAPFDLHVRIRRLECGRCGEQCTAFFGEPRLAPLDLEQPDAEAILQSRRGMADRRLAAVQELGRLGETALVDDDAQHGPLFDGGLRHRRHGRWTRILAAQYGPRGLMALNPIWARGAVTLVRFRQLTRRPVAMRLTSLISWPIDTPISSARTGPLDT